MQKSNATSAPKVMWAIDCAVVAAFAVPLCITVFAWPSSQASSVASTMTNLTGVLVGFVFAALSILVSVNDQPFILRIKDSGHYGNLLAELAHATVWLAVALLTSVISLFAADEPSRYWVIASSAAFFAGAMRMAFGAFKFYRVMQLI